MTRRVKAGLQGELVLLVVASMLLTTVLPSCVGALACDMPCCADDPAEDPRCTFGNEGHQCQLATPITPASGWTVPLVPAALAPMILAAPLGPIRSDAAVDVRGEDLPPFGLRRHVLLSVFRI